MERLFKDTKFLESFNTLFECYNNHLKATVNFQCNELQNKYAIWSNYCHIILVKVKFKKVLGINMTKKYQFIILDLGIVQNIH